MAAWRIEGGAARRGRLRAFARTFEKFDRFVGFDEDGEIRFENRRLRGRQAAQRRQAKIDQRQAIRGRRGGDGGLDCFEQRENGGIGGAAQMIDLARAASGVFAIEQQRINDGAGAKRIGGGGGDLRIEFAQKSPRMRARVRVVLADARRGRIAVDMKIRGGGKTGRGETGGCGGGRGSRRRRRSGCRRRQFAVPLRQHFFDAFANRRVGGERIKKSARESVFEKQMPAFDGFGRGDDAAC